MAQRMANYEQELKAIVSAPPRPLHLNKRNDLSAEPGQNIPRLRSQTPDTNLQQLRRPSSITSVPQREPDIHMAAVRVASREPTEPS